MTFWAKEYSPPHGGYPDPGADELTLRLGLPVSRVPSEDSVIIVRGGVMKETRPILEERRNGK